MWTDPRCKGKPIAGSRQPTLGSPPTNHLAHWTRVCTNRTGRARDTPGDRDPLGEVGCRWGKWRSGCVLIIAVITHRLYRPLFHPSRSRTTFTPSSASEIRKAAFVSRPWRLWGVSVAPHVEASARARARGIGDATAAAVVALRECLLADLIGPSSGSCPGSRLHLPLHRAGHCGRDCVCRQGRRREREHPEAKGGHEGGWKEQHPMARRNRVVLLWTARRG